MNYKEFNDYELLYQIKDNDEQAYEILEKKYMPIVISKFNSNSNSLYGMTLSDFTQEYRISLLKAIENYKENASSFKTYLTICLEGQIHNLIRENFKLSNKSSINAFKNNSFLSNLGIELSDILIKKGVNFISEEILNIKQILTVVEFKIFYLKYLGYSVQEQSEICNYTYRKIIYINKNIKEKLRKNYKSFEFIKN